jgi:hypothetical protein
MINFKDVWCFALCALAVWRVAHLMTGESGPWDLVERLRASLGFGLMGRLMGCFYCISFLVALPPALWMSSGRTGFLIQWMALSAVACLLEKATQKPHGQLLAYPLPAAYLDKVIRGV